MAKTEYNEQERKRIGEMLKAIRLSKGMSLREAGERSGINFANVDKVEKGVYSTTLDVLTSIARAYDMQVSLTPTPLRAERGNNDTSIHR